MMKLTKGQRRQVREMMTLAHARRLSEALEALEEGFKQWRAGEIDAFELDERIHEHHQGPSRELWRLYESVSYWEYGLTAAIQRGFLKPEDFPEDLWEAIGPRIEEIRKFVSHDD